MGSVLVTGGTGVLGTHLVRVLGSRAHDVRVLSRVDKPALPTGVSAAQGDVRTGVGLERALGGIDCVVHAATSPFRRARRTEVDGASNVLAAAARAGVGHVIYVSIVGVDAQPWIPYYRAKWAAEHVVEGARTGWTIQRITQFHELLDQILRLPATARTQNLSFQPIAAADAAIRIADLVDTGPTGRAVDIGGPEVLGIREIAVQRRDVTGDRTRLLPLPRIGPLAALDAGANLAGAARSFGTITWRQWLEHHIP